MIPRWIDAVRRNHALEHATVAVLLARHGPLRLAGRASPDGFFILGDVDGGELTSCAHEALARLRSGQSGLAVSPLCGTNIAVAGLLAGTAAASVLASGDVRSRFPNAVTAAMVAVMISQPLGHLVQKHVTTRADLDHVEVLGTHDVIGNLKKVRTRAVAP